MNGANQRGARRFPAPEPPAPAPLVSVVINTVDRAHSLAVLLAALEQQDYPRFEVLVVVGPTRDDTLALLESYRGRLRVLRCPQANLGASRNIGLLAACGEFVAFIDDDAAPCRTWLAQLVGAFTAGDVALVGGCVHLVHPAQPVLQHRLGVVSNLGEQQNIRSAQKQAAQGKGVLWTERPMGTNMVFRRSALLAVGGFDDAYAWVYDDADAALRLALAGYTVRGLAAAPVYHVPASSRNRVVRTFTGRWWVGTQAAAYFAMQNGRAAGQSAKDIVIYVLQLVHGEWLLSGELNRGGKISGRQMWLRRLRGTWAALRGALAGLGSRRLLSPQTVAARVGTDGGAAQT